VASGWIAARSVFPAVLISAWQPALAAVGGAGVLGLAGWQSRRIEKLPFSPQSTAVVKTGGLRDHFSLFKWLYEFLWAIYRGLRNLVAFLTLLFEGKAACYGLFCY